MLCLHTFAKSAIFLGSKDVLKFLNQMITQIPDNAYLYNEKALVLSEKSLTLLYFTLPVNEKTLWKKAHMFQLTGKVMKARLVDGTPLK